MVHFREKDRYDYGDLLEIIRILRSPEGCPWDQVQTHASIRRGLLEEAYEAAEAIDRDDAPLLQEELGDVLMQVVFHADIERQRGRFTMEDVVDGEEAAVPPPPRIRQRRPGKGCGVGAGQLGRHQAPGKAPAHHRPGHGQRGSVPARPVAGGKAPE